LTQLTGERVVVLRGTSESQELLARGDASLDSVQLVVMDEGFMDSSPALADSLLARTVGATALFLNLAIINCDRMVREVRLALQRRQREKLMAARAAEESLRAEVTNHVTGILLNCELTLKSPLSAEAASKLREIQRLAGELKSRLARASSLPQKTGNGRVARKRA
jgi:hypothetical protein